MKQTTLAALIAGLTVAVALIVSCALILGLLTPTADLTVGFAIIASLFAGMFALTVHDKETSLTGQRNLAAHWQKQYLDLAFGRTGRPT